MIKFLRRLLDPDRDRNRRAADLAKLLSESRGLREQLLYRLDNIESRIQHEQWTIEQREKLAEIRALLTPTPARKTNGPA